jgi:hypothetical protein
MLLKTHVEKMSALGLAKISMKTKDIDCSCQDVYEKKGGWSKPKNSVDNIIAVQFRYGFGKA